MNQHPLDWNSIADGQWTVPTLLQALADEVLRDGEREFRHAGAKTIRTLAYALLVLTLALGITAYRQRVSAATSKAQLTRLKGRVALTCNVRAPDRQLPTALPASVTLVASPREKSGNLSSVIEKDVMLLDVKRSGDTTRATLALTAAQFANIAPVLASTDVYIAASIESR
jgi:hypothetical protein